MECNKKNIELMHIAFLTPEYPHEKVVHAAGIATSIKNLATALNVKGLKVTIFVYSQPKAEIFEENGITIHLIEHKKYPLHTWFFYRKHLQDYLNTFIVKENIDLVEAPDWTGITAFMKLKVPLIVRFHGSDAYFCNLEGRKQKWKNFWFEKQGINGAKAFIAPTEFAGNRTKEIFNIQGKTIQTIHYGLTLQNFENHSPKIFTKGLLLYIGTIIRKKGVLEFPEILKKIVAHNPEAHLILIGADSFDIQTQSESTWELIQNQSDQTVKNKMTYLGKVPYSEVQEYIRKANVCVFPTFAETLGMVTIESMAMQKAVVNSDIGWANELIEDGESGYLVHPTNHELFASKVISLLENKEVALEIGKKARKRVEDMFNMDKIVHQNIDFYKRHL